MKKFLENVKSEMTMVGCQLGGFLVTGSLYLWTLDLGFLLFAGIFGILLVAVLVDIWMNSRK